MEPPQEHQQPGTNQQLTLPPLTDDEATPISDAVDSPPPPRPAEGEWEEVTMEVTAPEKPVAEEDTELRLILVGKSGGGKSATGNTILGRREFESILSAKATTLKCQKAEGSWNDRRISVIDTPALFDSEEIGQSLEMEENACLEMCRSGLHAFILVTQVGRFTAEDVVAAKRVWQIFGDKSTGHTIVLFTCLEDLGGDTLQEYIKRSDNKALRELIRQCGDRFCGFNNKAVGEERERQISELMKTVESVSENGRRCYIIEVPKKSPDSASANRLEKAGSFQGPERRIVLMGRSQSGKSVTGNTILGRQVFETSPTKSCRKEEMLWNGRRIVVVDTPGVLHTGHPERANTAEVSEHVKLCSPGPHAILWVTRPDRFSPEEKDVARRIKGMISENGRSYTILLSTHKDKREGESAENVQDQKEFFAEWGNRYLAFNITAEGEEREAQVAELMRIIDRLVFENGDDLYYKGKSGLLCQII